MHAPDDAWAAPKSPPPDFDESGAPRRPGVVTWFRVYCVLLALLYGLIAALLLIAIAAVLYDPPADWDDQDRVILPIVLGVIGVVCLALGAVFGVVPFLPRRPWVWVYGIVLIALGLSSCATWPMTIPLLIYWLRPDAKRYFGRAGA